MAVTITTDGSLDRGGGVVETSGGDKYAVFRDGSFSNDIHIFSSIDGTPSSEYNGNVGNNQPKAWIDIAIDSTDKIHIIIAHTTNFSSDILYAVWNTVTDTWTNSGEFVASYDEGAPTYPGCAISLDSDDYPHVLFVDSVKQTGSIADNVYYTERTGGSWSTATQIGTRATKTDSYHEPRITIRNSDYREAYYYFDSGATNPAYKTYISSWSSESTYSSNWFGATVPAITSTTSGTVYRYHSNTSETIYEASTVVAAGAMLSNTELSASLVDTDRYIFYIDTSGDTHYYYNTGSGWTDGGAMNTGTYQYIIAEWGYNNENQSGGINYIFEASGTVYYDSLSFAARRVFVTHV